MQTDLKGTQIAVTNSVTNPLENRGQSRATVTNFVTKLRAIQGNEITTFGEARAMEGN
jgi:type IV secretory pathway TrbF-like protein